MTWWPVIVRHKHEDDQRLIAAYTLDVYSTAQIIEETVHLRKDLSMIWSDEDWYDDARIATLICVSNVLGGDNRVLLDLSRPAGDGEYAILAVTIDDSTWLRNAQPPISSSFNEFVERCVADMIASELGFDYWHGPHTPNDDMW